MTAFYGFPRDSHSYSAEEVGHALAGLVQRESSGLPCVGMLSVGPDFDAVPASWRVQVGRFVYVHQAAGAIQLSGLSAPEQVDITNASAIPAGQSRIDLVGWNPVSAELVVVEGAPSATPIAPVDSSLAPVGTAQVNAGDGMVIAGQVRATYQVTDLAGAAGVVGAFTPGIGWTVVGGTEESSLERIGRVAYLNTALVIAAPGSFTSILTVPPEFRPEKDVFVGYSQVSGGAGKAHGQLWLRTTGVLQLRYYQGSTNAGLIMPIAASWRLPRG